MTALAIVLIVASMTHTIVRAVAHLEAVASYRVPLGKDTP